MRRWRDGLDRALVRKRGRRLFSTVAVTLAFLLVAGAAGAVYYWNEIGDLFTRHDLVLDPAGGGVLNVLIIGSDDREFVSDPGDVLRFGHVGGRRADTIILAQVVPSERRGTLLHFPRDLLVTIPGDPTSGRREQRAKINSSYNHGAQAVIDTVQALTGIAVNHYLELDMHGFRTMVDAIGGIEICTEVRLRDRIVQLELEPGVHRLDGMQALSYVRSRGSTPDGDFGRIERQQQFLRAVVRKVGSPRVLGNPMRVNELARAFASNVAVDQHFHLDDMVRFLLQVRRVGPEQMSTWHVPGRIGRMGDQSIVHMNQEEAEIIFDALQRGVDPAEAFAPPPAPEAAPEAPPAEAPPPEAAVSPEPEGPCAGF